jgi:hypothetical protein
VLTFVPCNVFGPPLPLHITQLRFHEAWPAALPLFAVVWGLLGSPASFSVAGGLLPVLLELRGAFLAAGGGEFAAVRNRWDDEVDHHHARGSFKSKVPRIHHHARTEEQPESSDDAEGDDLSDGGGRGRRPQAASTSHSTAATAQVASRVLDSVIASGIRAMGVELFTRLVPFSGTPEVSP